MLRGTSVWVTWREKRKRWEVGFWWEKHQYTFYSWVFQGQKFSFTKENWFVADEFASHIRAKMRPNEDGFCTFEPGQLKTGRLARLFWLKNH